MSAHTESNAKFARMLKLEEDVRTNYVLAVMGSDLATRWRGEDNLAKCKVELFGMLDNLTPEEVKAFGEYRKANR